MKSVGVDAMALKKLVTTELDGIDGEKIVVSEVGRRYVVLFFFSALDCPSCLEELTQLEEAETSRADLEVIAVMSYGNEEEARQLRGYYGFNYAIVNDESGLLLQESRIPKTPWKVMIDVASSTILLQDPPSNTAEERLAFFNRLMVI